MTIQDVIDEMMSREGSPADMIESMGISLEEFASFENAVKRKYPPEQAIPYLLSFCLMAGEMYGRQQRKLN